MMMENDVGATRSDGFAVIDGKALPVAGTSVQAREIWRRMVLLAVLDEMVNGMEWRRMREDEDEGGG